MTLPSIEDAGPAHAKPLTKGQPFSQFNALIFNGFSGTSDGEGIMVGGGNLKVNERFDIKPGSTSPSSYSTREGHTLRGHGL